MRYFVNNLAAVVLQRVDEYGYKETINKIKFSSAKDILELGICGHPSEVSSAAVQSGEASLVQAWSASTYLELIEAIYPFDY